MTDFFCRSIASPRGAATVVVAVVAACSKPAPLPAADMPKSEPPEAPRTATPRPVQPVTARTSPLPPSARQLVLAVTSGWDDSRATLRRFVLSGDEWSSVGEPWPAVTGRAGLGWGRGLHGNGAPPGRPGPIKAEGDGRAVAGAFRLGPAFGYDPSPPPGARVPYTPSGDTWRCVDDPASRHYGELLDASGTEEDWTSAEHLRRSDELYRLLLVVQHNPPPRKPGAGSCIFLHVWKNPDSTTSGCTAMPLARVKALTQWLEPGRAVFVALPKSELSALGSSWRLPAVSR